MGDDWDKVRDQWQRLAESRLEPEQVFDESAQARIAHALAREALSASGMIGDLKRSRHRDVYYRRQAADAQDQAHRARSLVNREAWLRLAHNWLNLLNDTRAKETAPNVDHRNASKRSH
jgi:hypothetical protein